MLRLFLLAACSHTLVAEWAGSHEWQSPRAPLTLHCPAIPPARCAEQMYEPLADRSDAAVRKNTLMVLTHLILNDMMKASEQGVWGGWGAGWGESLHYLLLPACRHRSSPFSVELLLPGVTQSYCPFPLPRRSRATSPRWLCAWRTRMPVSRPWPSSSSMSWPRRNTRWGDIRYHQAAVVGNWGSGCQAMAPGRACTASVLTCLAFLPPPTPCAQGTSPIYNLLPDILSNLSKEASLSKPQFQAIMQHVRGARRGGSRWRSLKSIMAGGPRATLGKLALPPGRPLCRQSLHTSHALLPSEFTSRRSRPPTCAAAGLHQEGQAGRLAD